MLGNITRSLLSQTRRVGIRSYHEKIKPAHMDEILVPMNSWKEAFEAKQRKYNMHFIFCIAFTVGSIAIIYWKNLVDHKVWGPPKLPKKQ